MSELIEAKRNLYLLLLRKSNDEITDAEINIRYELAKDDDIQAILNNAIQREKEISNIMFKAVNKGKSAFEKMAFIIKKSSEEKL